MNSDMLPCMEKGDARTLSQEAQEEVRRQAIKGLESGKSQAALARELDVSRAALDGW